MMRIVGLALALATGMSLPPVRANAAGVAEAARAPDLAHRARNTIYDLYLGGIWAGVLTIDAKFEPTTYSAASILRTAGIVGFFYKASFEAEAHGTLGDGGLAPVLFIAASRMKKKEQYVEMEYEGAAPSAVRAEPPFVPKPWEIDPAAQTGTIDPITAAITALAPLPLAQICNRTVEIYDGRRRYAIDIGAPVFGGERIRCPALYRRVAGFKPKMMRKTPTFPFDVWYEERPDGLTHLVRVAGGSMFGVAVVLLRE